MVKWKTFGKEGRLETSLVDLKSETEVEQTHFSLEEKLFVYANLGNDRNKCLSIKKSKIFKNF